jgi:[ribosomal protein S5]-alanine N-acetyltransferase
MSRAVSVGKDMHIETARLILRELREDDWPNLVAYWSDPRYQRYYPDIEDVEGAVRDLVGVFVMSQTARPRRTWQLALVSKADGRLIGNCSIRVNEPEWREANIGYELNPRDWGHGFATEAARAILGFGFAELDLHRVWAECVADNAGSVRVLEKLGLRREAHFREHRRYKGRWWDTLIYAILDHEWRSARAEPSPDDTILPSPA